jgi:MFS family permease
MLEPAYQFTATEHPALPGGPYTPAHPPWRRGAYLGVALMTATTATLGNGLVSTNLPNIAGSAGEYVAAVSILPAIYVAMNATGNLSIVKTRIQWGIPAATQGALAVYAFAAMLQLLFPTYSLTLAVRAANGLAAAALFTVTVYYLLQVFPPKRRPAALVTGLGFTQLGIPLARLFPVETLAQHHWRNLHLIEFALPLLTLALMYAFPLPPSDKSKAFEPLDFITIALVVSAMLLICSVLGLGRVYWWTDTPWLGWTLAASVPLLAMAVLIETNRAKPLLHLEWMGTGLILRFAAVALLMRIALAEQTYGSVGLLASGGLDNEQLRTVFAIVLGAMFIGIATAVLTLRAERLRHQVVVAALSIALGAWLDSRATNLTRPHELYLSQALLGFGATMFIGPTMTFGLIRMMQRGPAFFVSLVVLFSSTQNVGGLAGSAFLGTYEVIAARAHATALAEHLTAADPQVVARIKTGTQLLADSVSDPAQQLARGSALLARAQAREATVLAFNDVFSLVALLALATAVFVLCLILRDKWRAWSHIANEARA